jgi:hypothetical protein
VVLFIVFVRDFKPNIRSRRRMKIRNGSNPIPVMDAFKSTDATRIFCRAGKRAGS